MTLRADGSKGQDTLCEGKNGVQVNMKGTEGIEERIRVDGEKRKGKEGLE